jgi:epsin
VVDYARQNLHVIRTLKEFQHVDDEGKDQGANGTKKRLPYSIYTVAELHIHYLIDLSILMHVLKKNKTTFLGAVRQKSKDIVALVSDDTRLREERASRRSMKQRLSGGGSEYSGSTRARASTMGTMANGTIDEDEALRRAIEESKKSAAEYEAKHRKT